MIFESDLAPEALRELILANASRDFRERKPFYLHSELDGVLEISVRVLALAMRQAQVRLRILPASRGSVLEVEVVERRGDGLLLGGPAAVLLVVLGSTAWFLEPASRLFLLIPALPLAYYPWALARRYQAGPTQLLGAMARLAAGQVPERTGAPMGQRALLALASLPVVLLLGAGLVSAPLALFWPPFPPGDGRALLADEPPHPSGHDHLIEDLRQAKDPLVAYALVDKLLPCGYPCTYYALEGQARILKELVDPAKLAPAEAERLLAARTRAAEARPSLKDVVGGLSRGYLARTLGDLGPAAARPAVRKRAADLAVGPVAARQAYLEAGDLQGLRRAGLDHARPAEWFGIVTGTEAAGAAAVLSLAGLEAGEPLARQAALSTFDGIEIYAPEDVVRYQTFVAREAALLHLLRRRLGQLDVPAPDPFAPGRPLNLAGGEGWSVGIDAKDDGGKPYALAGHPKRHWESGSGASCWDGLEGDLPLLHGGKLAL